MESEVEEWDAAVDGTQIGQTLTSSGVAVVAGLFTLQLDFGDSAFAGEARWLEIAVRCPPGGGEYAALSPRQPLTAAPYALYAPSIPLAGSGSATWARPGPVTTIHCRSRAALAAPGERPLY
jgi:hypothetical protein